MRAMVRVYNDNNEDYKELWKDQNITVPAKGYIRMSSHDANHFLSRYSGTGPGGIPKVKMLRIVAEVGSEAPEVFACNKCGKEFPDKLTLGAHTEIHKEEVFVDPELEKKPEVTPAVSPYVTKVELNEKLDALQRAIISAIKPKK